MFPTEDMITAAEMKMPQLARLQIRLLFETMIEAAPVGWDIAALRSALKNVRGYIADCDHEPALDEIDAALGTMLIRFRHTALQHKPVR